MWRAETRPAGCPRVWVSQADRSHVCREGFLPSLFEGGREGARVVAGPPSQGSA
jgi:hypothetical protein